MFSGIGAGLNELIALAGESFQALDQEQSFMLIYQAPPRLFLSRTVANTLVL